MRVACLADIVRSDDVIVSGRVSGAPIDLLNGLTIADSFPSEMAAKFIPCPDETVGDGWLYAAGAFSAPPPLPVRVPASVTRAQGKIQLLRAGKLDAVKAAVAQDPELQIWFDDATVWERQNPHVLSMGAQLGLSSEDIDGLFIAAEQIAA